MKKIASAQICAYWRTFTRRLDMKKIFLPFCLLLSAVCIYAQEGQISLRYVKEFVIQPSVQPSVDNNGIYTVQNQQKQQSGVFRPPPGRNDGPKWMDVDLVYVIPGGLERQADSYTLSLDTELNDRYNGQTFSFSGRADSLVYKSGMGWGTENLSGNFIPYLLKKGYEKVDEPVYEFFWQRNANVPKAGDAIYLNYLFKIPQQSKTMWGNELAITRFTFAGGSFSANAPEVKTGSVVVWKRGDFEIYEQSLMRAPLLKGWKLPPELKLTSFAVSLDRKNLYTASHDGIVSAYTNDGEKIWSLPGRAPVIVYASSVIAMTEDYNAVQIIDRKTGKRTGGIGVPKYLPKDDNSFAVARCEGAVYLFFQLPGQSRIMTFRISK
jgi:hypothetical protein